MSHARYLLAALVLFFGAAIAQADTLTVYTWNVETTQQWDANARAQMDYIANLVPRPQVVIIEEAHPDLWPGSYVDELTSRTGVQWQGVFAKHCIAYSGSTCTQFHDNGVAVMTSLPLLDTPSTMISPHCNYWIAGVGIGRVGVNFNGTPIQIFGTHLQVDDPGPSSTCPGGPSRAAERAATAADLKNWAASYSGLHVIGGDFNASSGETAITTITASYPDAWVQAGSGNGNTWELRPGCDTSNLIERVDYVFSDIGGGATLTDKPGLSDCFGGHSSDHIGVRARYSIGSTPGWADQDIGAVGVAGNASISGSGVWTVNGAGADIWGFADAFHFVYQPLSGDGQVTAQVHAVQNTSAFAKAGVMLRDGLDPGAAHVILDVRPNGEAEFMTRTASGGSTTFLATASAPAPYWVRLTRAGNVFTGYVSPDGASWIQVGTVTVTMNTTLDAGLAVTSHDTSTLNSSTFEGASVLPAPWTNQDVGGTGLIGNAAATSGNVFSIGAAGVDIWGASDAFHFVYKPLSGDGQITARVDQVQNTDSFAKAGVMMRATTDANSADVIVDLRPTGAIEFMQRSTTGGSTSFVATGTGPWVRLSRSGNTFTGYTSPDGSAWTSLGSVSVTMPSTIDVGLAVTSHNSAVLNTSTLSNVQ